MILRLYEKYLEMVDTSLNEFFEQQKPYIFCKEGCSICCEEGEYPFSKLEMEYAMLGYINLNDEEKIIVQKNVEKIKEDKKNFKPTAEKKKFMHKCPFLITKRCSIYKYRGLVCRNHGLTAFTKDKDDKTIYQMPHCVNDGLNYSNVYDENTKTLSSAKWKLTGIEIEPVAHNVSRDFLMDNETTKYLELEFGESKALIEWL